MKKPLLALTIILMFVLSACGGGTETLVEDAIDAAEGVATDVGTAEQSESESAMDAEMLIGEWVGVVEQPNSDTFPTYQTVMIIEEVEQGYLDYPELQCGGPAELVEADGVRYVVSADLEGFVGVSEIYNSSASETLVLEMQVAETFTINPSDGVDQVDSRDTQIVIAPDQLVDENGDAPVGEVTMEMYTYDLENEEMVGDMTGTNQEGEEVSMVSAGAFHAEFTDEAGNEINLADGATAEISIPAALLH